MTLRFYMHRMYVCLLIRKSHNPEDLALVKLGIERVLTAPFNRIAQASAPIYKFKCPATKLASIEIIFFWSIRSY